MDEEILIGKTLLIVDDEVDLRDIISSEMQYMGAKVFQAPNISIAKEILTEHLIDLVISDIRMPGGTGIELLDLMREKDPFHPPVVLITGFADISPEDAFNKGADALLNKPFMLDDLIGIVARNTLTRAEQFSTPDSETKSNLNIEFKGSFLEIVSNQKFLMGRGGFSCHHNQESKRPELGSLVKFSIQFSDLNINGVGIYRWCKGHAQLQVGVEFKYLEEASLKFFEEYLQRSPTKSFIPLASGES